MEEKEHKRDTFCLGINDRHDSVGRNVVKKVFNPDEVLLFSKEHPPYNCLEGYTYASYNSLEEAIKSCQPTKIISFVGKGILLNPFDEKASQDSIKMLESNFLAARGLIATVQKIAPYTPILFCNSIVSQQPHQGDPDYTASKFALNGFIQALRARYKDVYISQLHFQGVRFIGYDGLAACVKAWCSAPNFNYDFIIQ